MKLTDEKILNVWRNLETKPTSVCVTVKDIVCFARAILKEAQVEELEREQAHAKREAGNIAMYLWRKYYQAESPNFGLCDSAAGVMTQIDNMLAGVHERMEELERDAERWQYDLSTRYEQHLHLCKHVNITPDTFEQFTAYTCEANDRQREQINPNKK